MATDVADEHCRAEDIITLDQCETPSLVYTKSNGIIYLNRALRRLFNDKLSALDLSLFETFPIQWTGDSKQELYNVFHGSFTFEKSNLGDPQPLLCRIQSSQSELADTSEARIHVRKLSQDDAYWVLSFEDGTKATRICGSCQRKATETRSSELKATAPIDARKSSLPNVMNEDLDHLELERQFQKLRDAIFYNSERSGFLLSADGKFCFPHYKGESGVQPVRVDNLEEFFGAWDVWDPQFKEKVPVSELPAIKLHRTKQALESKRYGMKEAEGNIVVETTGSPLWNHDSGEYIGGVVWVRNLGPYEQSLLNDLHSSLSDFQAICDQLPHICWTAHSDGHVDYFSQQWYDYTGLSKVESLADGFERAIHPEDLEPLRTEFHAAVTTKSPLDARGRYRRHDGVYSWLSIVGRPILDDSGNILKWYGTMTEIENLVAEGIAADKQKQRMEQMLDAAEISLFRIDDSWNFTMLQGKPLSKTKPGHDLFTVLANMNPQGITQFENNARRIMNGEIDSAVFEYQLETRWHKCCLIGERDASTVIPVVVGILGCQLDITDQRQTAALQIENNRLVAERLISIERARLSTEFLGHVSHEIRTPIAGVIGMSEMLKITQLDDAQVEMVANILTSAHNLLNQVNDILDLSKIQNQSLNCEMASFRLLNLVVDTCELFQRSAAEKGVQFKYLQRFPDNLDIVSDRIKVRQILSHLLSNAIKFTPRGSVSISVSSLGPDICFCVTDTGIGMNQDVLDRIFKPFAQGDSSTNRLYGGTGLGLTISRSLAELMGGKLEIESEAGKGTVVSLHLPRTSPPAVVGRIQRLSISKGSTIPTSLFNEKHNASLPDGKEAVVLVVEDNLINSRVAMHLVKKLGYQSTAAFNGQEALEYLRNCSDHVVLILMDCQMPILDGYETTRRLRGDDQFSTWRHVPIVALTASTIQGDRDKCRIAGMNEYLSKPVTYAQFKHTVAQWLPERN